MKLMILTRAATYGLKAVIELARQKTTDPLPSHELARRHAMPERYLPKILKPLVEAGVLLSVKGPSGGYRLSRHASQITLLDVIEGVEGPIRLGADDDSQELAEVIRGVDHSIELMRDRLRQAKLSDLVAAIQQQSA